eukprot:TRINITY_DN185_c0_g2_i2.p1 TRINITY_DN185_c0_g2~~TRINITY_DN185_c0_g2_i2.p1  ORF type:complete len:200 (-),score=46.65 TRINITY_DN185_c0_g2_i2:106-666(-)
MSFSFNGSQQFGGNAFANGVFISGASASASTGPVAPAQTALPIKSPKKLFLSYRRGTGAHLVQRLRTKLEPLYSSVFVDTESITGGAEWKRVIEKAIEECDAFVLLCTPDFLSKTTGSSGEWVVREFCMAVDKKKLILPIRSLTHTHTSASQSNFCICRHQHRQSWSLFKSFEHVRPWLGEAIGQP